MRLVILNFVNPNIVNFSKVSTSLSEGHLYQSFLSSKNGSFKAVGLVSECRITKNTTNDNTFSQTFFYILRIKIEYFMTTLTMADTKQEKRWLKI